MEDGSEVEEFGSVEWFLSQLRSDDDYVLLFEALANRFFTNKKVKRLNIFAQNGETLYQFQEAKREQRSFEQLDSYSFNFAVGAFNMGEIFCLEKRFSSENPSLISDLRSLGFACDIFENLGFEELMKYQEQFAGKWTLQLNAYPQEIDPCSEDQIKVGLFCVIEACLTKEEAHATFDLIADYLSQNDLERIQIVHVCENRN